MATEAGHVPSIVYHGQNGDLHLGGANAFDKGELAFAQQVTFAAAAGSANVCNVTIQVNDGRGAAIARPFELMVYLSDSSTGNGLTATTASGTVGAGSAGTDLQAKVAKKATDVLTDNTGKYVLSITDTVKTGFFVCAFAPGTGNLQVSAQLVTGNYG
jgi:hypothetical protein